MVCLCKVTTYSVVLIPTANVVEMTLESVHKSSFGLAYILFATRDAGYAVDKVDAFACDLDFCGVCLSGTVTPNLTLSV